MWAFTTLLSMAAAGLVTMIGSMILVNSPAAVEASMAELLTSAGFWIGALGVLGLGGYGGYRGFTWFFYDRHAHRRVNKRSA